MAGIIDFLKTTRSASELRIALEVLREFKSCESVDSTNCAQNGARNGKAIDKRLTSGQGAIITAWRIESHNSPATWDGGAPMLVREKMLF